MKTALCLAMLVLMTSPAFSGSFWSPREIVLDTYERPIPFRLADATCLAYELHITNMDVCPISVKQIEIRAKGSDAPLKVYSEEVLKKSLSRVRVPGGREGDDIVNEGQRAILHVLLEFQNKDEVPQELSHKVMYSFLREDGSEVEAITEGGVVSVAVDIHALIIGAPLGAGVWMCANGVEDGFSGHRQGVIRPQNGIPYQKARYAFDFIKLDEEGKAVRGNRSENTNWLGYGSEIIAIADANVEIIQDGIPDSRPFDPDKLNGLTGSTLGGNYIVLELGDDLYALCGHLKPGSITVRQGEAVKKGQVIGLLGNSGNSDAPHLHFQVNRHTPIRGEAVPYVFERYNYLGESDLVSLLSSSMDTEAITERITGGIADRMMERWPIGGDTVMLLKMRDMLDKMVRVDVQVSAKTGPAPDLNRQSEVRIFEMPKSGSLIRFVENDAAGR